MADRILDDVCYAVYRICWRRHDAVVYAAQRLYMLWLALPCCCCWLGAGGVGYY